MKYVRFLARVGAVAILVVLFSKWMADDDYPIACKPGSVHGYGPWIPCFTNTWRVEWQKRSCTNCGWTQKTEVENL